MDDSLIPRRLGHAEGGHEWFELVSVELGGHGGRADEGVAHFTEGGAPGRGGGGVVHVAGEGGLPVEFVEAHHVSWSRGGGEGFEGGATVFVALGSVSDGGGGVGFVEVAVAPELGGLLVLAGWVWWGCRSWWMGEGARIKNLRTYHADGFYGVLAAGVIGGVGPVVRVPGNGSVLIKRRLVVYLNFRESSNASFGFVRREIRARSCTARSDGRGARGAIELCYRDGRARGWSCRGSGARGYCSWGSVMIPLVKMCVLGT